MKAYLLLTMLAVTSLTAASALDIVDRYTLSTHVVPVNHSGESVPVMFKLDSVNGNIWRFAAGTFVQIPAEKTWTQHIVENQAAYVEREEAREAFRQRLREIIIPEVDFRQAGLPDVIAFLNEASRKHSEDGKGVNLILNVPDDHRVFVPKDPFAEERAGDTAHDDGVLITFSTLEVTLLEALDIVAELANLRWRHVNGAVMIRPSWLWPHEDDRVIRLYELLPSTIDRIQRYTPELIDDEASAETLHDRWRVFFSDYGVEWPRGSGISPMPLLGSMLITNTIANLRTVERVLEAINTYPPQAGRFRLVPQLVGDHHMLILLDSQAGHTWQYVISDYDSGTIQADSFTYLAH